MFFENDQKRWQWLATFFKNTGGKEFNLKSISLIPIIIYVVKCCVISGLTVPYHLDVRLV